jgi:DedD protein
VPPDGGGAAPPAAVAAAPPAAPEPRPELVTPSARDEQLAVQVGAFAESGAAERLAEVLRRKGFPVYVTPGTGEAGSRWRVRVGPLGSREEAERTAARLKLDEKLPTWVVDEDGTL